MCETAIISAAYPKPRRFVDALMFGRKKGTRSTAPLFHGTGSRRPSAQFRYSFALRDRVGERNIALFEIEFRFS